MTQTHPLVDRVARELYAEFNPVYSARIDTEMNVSGPTRCEYADLGDTHKTMLRNLALAAIRVVVEACAEVCERYAERMDFHADRYRTEDKNEECARLYDHDAAGARCCSTALRALAPEAGDA